MTHASYRPTSPVLRPVAEVDTGSHAGSHTGPKTGSCPGAHPESGAGLGPDVPKGANMAFMPTGCLQNQQIPDDQHRHRVDKEADKADHMPSSMRVLSSMKVR